MDENTTELAVAVAALAVLKPVAESASRLFENLVGEPCKVAGAMLADQLYVWQWKNRIKVMHRAQEIMEKDDVAAKVLPPGFLMPLIDNCGNIEDPELQELWARLLASSVENDIHQKVAFVHALKDLSVEEARLLQWMRDRADKWEKSGAQLDQYEGECTSVEARDYFRVSHSRIVFTAHSLMRLGLIAEFCIHQGRRLADRNTPEIAYTLTVFGSHFADACMGFSTPPERHEPVQRRHRS